MSCSTDVINSAILRIFVHVLAALVNGIIHENNYSLCLSLLLCGDSACGLCAYFVRDLKSSATNWWRLWYSGEVVVQVVRWWCYGGGGGGEVVEVVVWCLVEMV